MIVKDKDGNEYTLQDIDVNLLRDKLIYGSTVYLRPLEEELFEKYESYDKGIFVNAKSISEDTAIYVYLKCIHREIAVKKEDICILVPHMDGVWIDMHQKVKEFERVQALHGEIIYRLMDISYTTLQMIMNEPEITQFTKEKSMYAMDELIRLRDRLMGNEE